MWFRYDHNFGIEETRFTPVYGEARVPASDPSNPAHEHRAAVIHHAASMEELNEGI